MSASQVIAASGHRPQQAHLLNLPAFSQQQENAMFQSAKFYLAGFNNISLVITGGALGWDTAVARAAYSLGLAYAVYVPCKGQESRWNAEAQEKYRKMLSLATEVKYISQESYKPALMFARDKAMIDACSLLLVLWNPEKQSGGTYNAIQYARQINKEYINVWGHYRK
jgi:uncharacterized phage-like protein YoqJ